MTVDDPLAGSLDSVVRAAAAWPAPHVAAGVVVADRAGRVTVAARHGEHTLVQPWASLSKPVVALAVLVAVEEGTLDLDEPAGPPGSTIRHLLAHASGLAPDGSAVLSQPGRRRIYSNAGFEVLAEVLAERSGMPFGEYLRDGVTDPLGLTATVLPPGASPAAGMVGSLDDLLVLAAELLAPRLVAPSTMAAATAVAFPGLGGVVPGVGRFDPCDWGLGMELRDGKVPHWTASEGSPATFGHFGRSGGFLWVDPQAGAAAAALTGRVFGPWALTAWPPWSDAVLNALRLDCVGSAL